MARDINQNVNINVNANTNDAGRDIEKLERNIATLDGAINIVGGSVEVLAGALAITGAVSEEQAEKFQSAAIGAIAFADGSKRIIEGYRTLAKETKVLTVVQRVYNNVLKANPIFLLASVLAAVALGYALFTRRQNESADAAAEEAKRQKEVTAELEKQKKLRSDTAKVGATLLANKERQIIAPLERELKLLEAAGADEDKLFKKRQEIAQARITIFTELAGFYANDRKLATEFEEKKQNAINELQAIRLKEERRLAEAKMALIKAEEEAEEQRFQTYKDNYEKERALEKKALEDRMAADRAAAKAAKDAADLQTQLQQERLENNEEIATATIDTIQAAALTAFEDNKAIASASVLVDAGQAALGILNTSYKNVSPNLVIAYQVAQFALLAATTAQSLKNINSADPATGKGAGGGSTPRPQIGSGTFAGGSQGGIPTIPGFSTSGVTNLQAVVLAGDVTSAQAQDAAIRNRRRFG